MTHVTDREIVFGNIAKVPRICSPQIWTVQVDAEVSPAQIIASAPSHVIHCTAKLQQGLYSLATLLKSPDSSSKVGTVGSTVDFRGVTGKIVGVSDTVESSGRKQMIGGVLRGIEDSRRCRLGPFPRNWFIPDKIQNSKKKLPLFPKSPWITMMKHYGDVEKIWILQEGMTKVFLIVLFNNPSALGRLLTDGLGRYVLMPKNVGARPLEVTIVMEDDTPIAASLSGEIEIPYEIDGVSTRGMSSNQYLAFQALQQRVEMLERENDEMKDLLRDLQLAELAAEKAEQREKQADMASVLDYNPKQQQFASSMGMVQRKQSEATKAATATKPSRTKKAPNLNTNHPWKNATRQATTASSSAQQPSVMGAPVLPHAAAVHQTPTGPTDTPRSGRRAHHARREEGNQYTHPPMEPSIHASSYDQQQPQQPVDAIDYHNGNQPASATTPNVEEENNNYLLSLAYGGQSVAADSNTGPPPPANARRTHVSNQFVSSFAQPNQNNNNNSNNTAPWRGMAGRAALAEGVGLRRAASAEGGGQAQAPWKKLKTSGGGGEPLSGQQQNGALQAPISYAYAPAEEPVEEEKPALSEQEITDYHNLLLGVQQSVE